MNRFAVTCIVLTTVILAATSAPADILAPGSTVEGKTIGQWTAEWWNWAHSFGPGEDPRSDAAGILAVQNQTGPVFFVGGQSSTPVRTYDVPGDKYLLIPLVAATYRLTAGEDRDWAKDQVKQVIDPTDSLRFSLDGVSVPPAELFTHREESGFYTAVVAPGNFSGDLAGSWPDSSADGYWLMLEPLALGPHTILWGGEAISPLAEVVVTGTDDINVVPEPSTLGLLSMGTLALLAYAWRRRRAR